MNRPQAPFHGTRRSHRRITRAFSRLMPLALLAVPTAFAQNALPDSPGFLLAARTASARPFPSSPGDVDVQQAPAAAMPAAQTPVPQTGSAQITGIVSDIQGGLVPGAKVSLESKATRIRLAAVAGADGTFSFESLAAGDYAIYIEAPGLAKFASPVIVLKAAEHYTLPDIALPVVSDQSVDVYFTQKEIAQQEIHAEEKQRALGVFPNFYTSYIWDAAPLTVSQKFTLSTHAVVDPVAFGVTAAIAGVQQARGTYPEYGSGWSGYGKRYGSDYGNQFIGYMVGRALLPAIFRQDPRYFYMGTGTGKARAWHAVSSSFLCRGDKSTRYQVCYSHILGNLSAGAIANTYHPKQRGVGLTFGEAAIGIGGAAAGNLFREFIVKKISTHNPKNGVGKPANEPDEHKIK